MNFKTRFERKVNAPEVTDADIVGVVTLNQEQFARFRERLLDDYDFIADYPCSFNSFTAKFSLLPMKMAVNLRTELCSIVMSSEHFLKLNLPK